MNDNISCTTIFSDLGKLHETIEGLIGKRCWKANFGYGKELHLHLGAKIPYEHPKMARKRKGEWRFASCGTEWLLFTPRGTIASGNRSEDYLAKKIKNLEGSRLSSFEVSVPSNGLTMSFDNNYFLMVLPTPLDDKYEIPYWKLFLPDHKVISFGPGQHWSFERSDVPVS